MKKIAILQSNYIPWKGYFDLINQVDEFIIYDTVQYTKHDWRNRNKIKTPDGTKWLTIPIQYAHSGQCVEEAQIASVNWNRKHWKSILQNYAKAPFFNDYREYFEALYLGPHSLYLSQVNYKFLTAIAHLLGINTIFRFSHEFNLPQERNERLIALCKATGASEYLSGPAAQNYIDVKLFEQESIVLSWIDYSHYRVYPQLYPPFEHGVTILDTLFHCGPDALSYIKSSVV